MILAIDTGAFPGRAPLLALLDAAAWLTARWYLTELAAGREPPCCNTCATLRYVPDRPSARGVTITTVPALLQRGRGSCGELSALDAGRRRADAIRKGASLAEAATVAWVDLYLSHASRGDEVWHAIVRDRDGAILYNPENRPVKP